MKKVIIHIKIPALLLLLMIFSPAYSQRKEAVIDKNPIYSFEGRGFMETGMDKRMIFFSNSIIEGENKNEVSMNNNEMTINKDGIYRINISSGISKEAVKAGQAYYSVNLNGKEIFRSEQGSLSPQGVYRFQIQLKKDDILSFSRVDDQSMNNNDIERKNYLSVRYTDPELMEFSENH
ncbi:hypothetical protein HNP38_003262 [Chryseobacterium defluvii]|uniref:Uncharacterized protein n=1 Tax=Chryseobacterium defluvii TaxID=160396 RepID=A0A840KFH7_9FLAO|nr:hypothetical protein [Chryseobacterium defluvii]MBB4807946.1 hypothetical protein [Chryseobacterium defluvii]